MKKRITILFIVFASMQSKSQVNCFAQLALDRHSVYVQQPFKITITVLTATWYTAPLDFENIQIPSAFIMSFDQTTPGIFKINGKQFAGLQFYFIVFPYKEGNFTIPAIDITATTPPEGSAVSTKIKLKTSPTAFIVKPIPENMKDENWLVAKNVNIRESWNKSLQNLKVGDVVERTITIDASGTLPQFIPQLQKDSLDFASSYLQDADLKDERNDYDANGRLTQSMVYLLEKEGDFTIPAVQVKWWNPLSSRVYSRSAPAAKIRVKANPDLGILATLKDSLNATHASTLTTIPQKKKLTILGMPWYLAIAYASALLIGLYFLIRVSIRIFRSYKIRHAIYLGSEQYAFRKFMRAPVRLSLIISPLYTWWDKLQMPDKSSSISWQMHRQQFKNIGKELSCYYKELYEEGNSAATANNSFKKEIRQYREKMLKENFDPEENKISVYQSNF